MDKTTARGLSLAFVGEGDVPSMGVPRHAHQAPILIAYQRGCGRIVFDDREFPFARGTVACVPARVPYTEHTTAAGFTSLYLAVHGLAIAQPCVVDLGDDPRFELCARLVLEESRRQGRGSARAIADLLPLLARCLALRRGEAARHPLVTGALDLIAEHFGDPVFTIAAAARRLSTTVRRLRARFVAELGVPPQRLLTRHRIDEARRLLDHGGFPIAVVAERSGFSDPYYFSRAFRKQLGVSPSEYRASRRV